MGRCLRARRCPGRHLTAALDRAAEAAQRGGSLWSGGPGLAGGRGKGVELAGRPSLGCGGGNHHRVQHLVGRRAPHAALPQAGGRGFAIITRHTLGTLGM